MFPRAFGYFSPSSLAEALDLIKSGDVETRILAGGQSLLPAMKARTISPRNLVDLGGIRELNFISKDENTLKIGATVTTATIENDLEIACLAPILQETAREIADPLVRNLGTVGGNICHANPVNDFPPAMLAVNATFTLASAHKTRSVPADQFFIDRFKTVAKPNEILTQIQIPLLEGKVGNAYRKIRKGSGGFTIAGVAAQI